MCEHNSIPFDTDEISSCMQEKDFANVKSASELADNPNFLFLKEWEIVFRPWYNMYIPFLFGFFVEISIAFFLYTSSFSSFDLFMLIYLWDKKP